MFYFTTLQKLFKIYNNDNNNKQLNNHWIVLMICENKRLEIAS